MTVDGTDDGLRQRVAPLGDGAMAQTRRGRAASHGAYRKDASECTGL